MNFVKLSMSYEYLYSPKSWLHNQNISRKIATMIAHLILLPFIPLKHLLLLFFLLLIVYKSINLPSDMQKYFYAALTISSFFLLVSMQKNDMCHSSQSNTRQVLRFYTPNFCHAIDMLANKWPHIICLCIPRSTTHLIILHFIYLILIRCLLITTNQESIIRTVLIRYGRRKCFSIKFIFTTMVSSYFLKILFQQIKEVKISCILRSADINTVNTARVILLMYLSYLKQFLVKINAKVYTIASTLYSRNIQCTGLSIYNKYTVKAC
jgi:hypothetical protein